MTDSLKPGLYRLYWKDGGSSLAAVGMLHSGRNWFAPTNWTSCCPCGIACRKWELVEDVSELLSYAVELPPERTK